MAKIEANDFVEYDLEETKPAKQKKNKNAAIVADDDTVSSGQGKKRGRGLIIALVLIAAAALIGLGIFFIVKSTLNNVTEKNTIYAGVTLNGHSLEGMTEEEAAAYIKNTYIKPITSVSIEVRIGDEVKEYPLSEFVDYPDADAIAKEAFSLARSGSKKSKLKMINDLKTNPRNFEFGYTVHDETLSEIIDTAQETLFVEVVNPEFHIMTDRITFSPGKNGCNVNTQKLSDDLENTLNSLSDKLSKMTDNPKIVLDPVVVETENVPFIKLDALYISDRVHKDPVNATYSRKNIKELNFTSEINGITVDEYLLGEAVNSVNSGEDFGYKYVLLSEIPAEITVESLKATLFRDVIGSEISMNKPVEEGEDSTPYDERAVNIALAAEKIDGYILFPGEAFNFFTVVGDIDEYKGFTKAFENARGYDEKIMGGGLSQLASALYVSALYSDMKILEHSSSKYIVNYGQPGLDAYVEQGSSYFSFSNTSAYPVKIVTTYSGGIINVKILGTETRSKTFTISSENTRVILYNTIREEDPELAKGEQVTIEGIVGYEYAIYKVSGGVKTPLGTVVYEKKDKIVKVGTKEADTPDEPDNPDDPDTPDDPDVPSDPVDDSSSDNQSDSDSKNDRLRGKR